MTRREVARRVAPILARGLARTGRAAVNVAGTPEAHSAHPPTARSAGVRQPADPAPGAVPATFSAPRPDPEGRGPLAAVPPVSPPTGGAVPSVARSKAAACPPASAVAGPQLPARATHTST